MIYRINRSLKEEPIVHNDAPSTSKKSDSSVISEIRSLRADIIRHKETENELQRLRNQLKELTIMYDDLAKQEQQRKDCFSCTSQRGAEEATQTLELKLSDDSKSNNEGASVVSTEKEYANSISKYFSELLTGPEDEFRAVFYKDKNDSNEYCIKQGELYQSYKGWCSRNSENVMKQSNAMSYISDGHIDGVRCAKVKGDRVIKVNASFVIPASDE